MKKVVKAPAQTMASTPAPTMEYLINFPKPLLKNPLAGGVVAGRTWSVFFSCFTILKTLKWHLNTGLPVTSASLWNIVHGLCNLVNGLGESLDILGSPLTAANLTSIVPHNSELELTLSESVEVVWNLSLPSNPSFSNVKLSRCPFPECGKQF